VTALRLLGLLVGAGLLLYLFLRFRRAKIKRGEFALASLVALGVVAVSIAPDAATVLRDMLALEDAQFSRLIAVAIVSNLALWLLALHLYLRRAQDREQFDLLARRLAVREFEREYGDRLPLPPLVAVLPAYNEAANLPAVLRAMPTEIAGLPLAAIVIDDGSDDDTAAIARRCGAWVAENPARRGGGAALRIGFDIAERGGAEIVVTMDADGQHQPAEIANLAAPILADAQDIVIGSRLLGRRDKDSAVRLAGIYVFNALIRLLTAVRVTDCANGFRAMRVAVLRRLELRQDQYHTSELIIEAAKKGVRLGEAPVHVKRRLSGESKKGRNWKYGLNFAKTIIKTWWR